MSDGTGDNGRTRILWCGSWKFRTLRRQSARAASALARLITRLTLTLRAAYSPGSTLAPGPVSVSLRVLAPLEPAPELPVATAERGGCAANRVRDRGGVLRASLERSLRTVARREQGQVRSICCPSVFEWLQIKALVNHT
jgi:hypothetical protein